MKRFFSPRIAMDFMVMAAVAVLMTSCHYKDLEPYEPKYMTHVIADYSLLDYDHEYTNMRAVFFPLTAEMDFPFQTDVRDTAIVSLPEGSYSVLAYSNDGTHESVSFDGWNPSSMTISALHADNTGLPGSLGTVYDYPDRICAFDSVNVDVIKDELRSGWAMNDIFLRPREITRQLRIHLYGIVHPEKAERVRFVIDNVPYTYNVREHCAGDSLASMIVEGKRDLSEHSLFYGNMNIFGTGTEKHFVDVLIEGPGFKIMIPFDVTDQIRAQKDKKEITLELFSSHDLYDDIPSGFDIGVDDWKNHEIDIPM